MNLLSAQADNRFYMCASGEQIRRHSIFQFVSAFFQQRHIPGKGRRVTGDVDDPSGVHSVESFNGIGVEPLSGRIHYHHIGADPPGFQIQGRLTGISAEKLRVRYPVAQGILSGIFHSLLQNCAVGLTAQFQQQLQHLIQQKLE